MAVKLISEAHITKGARVFVRTDLDITNNTFRVTRAIPTLKFIINKGGLPIIAGHRAEGKSTKPLKSYFEKKLGAGNFELMENLRLDVREKQNDQNFANELASKADIYVNESFATCHRSHASIVSLPKLLPSYAGFNLLKELNTLDYVVYSSEKPLVAIIGGSKLESKLPVINRFVEIADYVLLGGKVALEWDGDIQDNLTLPKDFVDNKDIGEKTIEKFLSIIKSAKTIVWAGPMGMYETDKYKKGTLAIAQAIKESSAFSIVGGGNTIETIGDLDKFGFVSTGGSSMLKYIAEGTLVGVEALK